jgi:hypothetical protein
MMDYYYLLSSLLVAFFGPLLVLRYLRNILCRVIDLLCPAPGSSEFWWRVIVVMALTGSVLLTLMFGSNDETIGIADFLRHTLLLTTLAIFGSVAFIVSRIWSQITKWVHQQSFETRRPQPSKESGQS